MARRLNIGIDVDGVVSNFMLASRTLCKELFAGKPDDSVIQTSWAFQSLGISKDEENVLWRKIDNIPNWWMTHEPMAETSGLSNFAIRHKLVFITNRKDGSGWPIEEQTAMWLKRHFMIMYPTVVISDDKGPLGRSLKLDYFIDDRPKNVIEMKAVSPQTKTYLRADTYNADFDMDKLGYKIPSINTLNEFIQIVEADNVANRSR